MTESLWLPPHDKTSMHHMPDTNRDPSLLPIERPRCPKCQGRMMLARLAPGPSSGSELRTFECPKCDHVLQVLEEDPINSEKAGWQSSSLRAPE